MEPHPRLAPALQRSSPVVRIALLLLASVAATAQSWPEAHPPSGHQPKRPAGYQPFRYPKNPADLARNEGEAMRERARRISADVQATIDKGPYRADHESIGAHPAPEWFLDAKFGMFVDWGPWSVAGWAPQAEKATYPDWYEQRLFKEFRNYHVKTWGADIGPDDLIQLLRDDQFKPPELVALAQAAGMRYVVPFLKHHGGYALWDSSFTHRDSVEWGLHRNVAREIGAAAHAAGLRYGAYVSLGEWSYPVTSGSELQRLTFDGVTREPLTAETPFVSGKVPVANYTSDYLVPSIAELVEQSDPDMLWFDGEWESAPATWRSPDLAAFFYNRAAARRRDVAINDRFGKDTRGKAGWGDFYTSEYHVIEGLESHPWEENRSLSHSYGYNWEESLDDRYVLTDEQALDLLLRVVANGGNLLLMVSPDGSGRIPPNQERRLRSIGAWLARYGEAVYATRAAGIAQQPAWGYVTRSKSDDRVFCIVRRWPADGRLLVPIDRRPRAVRQIEGAESAPVSMDDGHPVVDLSGMHPTDPRASVIELVFDRAHAERPSSPALAPRR